MKRSICSRLFGLSAACFFAVSQIGWAQNPGASGIQGQQSYQGQQGYQRPPNHQGQTYQSPPNAQQYQRPPQGHSAQGQPGQYRHPTAQQGTQGQPQPSGQHTVLANGQPAQPQRIAIQPPFVLSPQQEAELNKLLNDWEAKGAQIKSFNCAFKRWEYNPTFSGNDQSQALAEAEGEIKYYAPDKGLFRVTRGWDNVFDQMTGKYKPGPEKPGDYWTCNGKSVFQVDHDQKTIEEHPLPPHLQGQAIANGPLPFVFGAKAAVLKQRYYMRITTPEKAREKEVWLEAVPRTQQDAANFSKIDLILSKDELLPVAMQMHNPAYNGQRTVINFHSSKVNSVWAPLQQMVNDFARPNVFGYRHVVNPPPAPAGNAGPQTQAQQRPQQPAHQPPQQPGAGQAGLPRGQVQ